TKSAPWGMAGGQNADAGHVVIWPGTDREERTGAIHYPVDAEDVLQNNSGGGGGWGNPFERDPQRVLEDVINDFVSLEAARRDYGVVIDADSRSVDEQATAVLRS
ncbi:MAG: hydantoinase B/oxoprolinase family protein, partial [Anaerolineaceae bacterium]|nr:hydantoinase B/oxoprolinase family protein [Anaerolineaceae bacterium]